MDEDLLADDAPREERDNLFAWTVFILLLIGFALACWLGTFYVFGHPENPRSYRLLQKLKKIEAPKRFEVTAAPPGEFIAAKKLYEKYITYPRIQLQNENDELLRIYINNYEETKRLVPYAVGRYVILNARSLTINDAVTSGVVALAQSVENPSLFIEYIYPAPEGSVPELERLIAPGVTVELKHTVDLSAIIHIQRTEGRLQLTLMPLLYGAYALKRGEGTFSLEPPPSLNMTAGFPVVRGDELDGDLRAYAGRTGGADRETAESGATSPKRPTAELVKVDSGPPPGVNVAIAAPVSPKAPEAAPTPTPTPVPALAMNATPAPPEEKPAPVSTPLPVLSPDGVPLQPFLVSKNAPPPTSLDAANWRVYPPGQMPRGRLVGTADLSALADRSVGGERLYLRGQFVVTASQENRAILRPRGSLGDALSHLVRAGGGSPRIIVEFPSSALPPTEGASLTRDESRPFQIVDVRRGADGEVNVYAREVTQSP